jgi:hypothetical protein
VGALNAAGERRRALGGVRVSRAAVARLWVACGLCVASVGVALAVGLGVGLLTLGVSAVAFGLTIDVDGDKS